MPLTADQRKHLPGRLFWRLQPLCHFRGGVVALQYTQADTVEDVDCEQCLDRLASSTRDVLWWAEVNASAQDPEQ